MVFEMEKCLGSEQTYTLFLGSESLAIHYVPFTRQRSETIQPCTISRSFAIYTFTVFLSRFGAFLTSLFTFAQQLMQFSKQLVQIAKLS